MDRDSVSGYVSPAAFVNEGKLELLNTSGTVIAIDLREIKGRFTSCANSATPNP